MVLCLPKPRRQRSRSCTLKRPPAGPPAPLAATSTRAACAQIHVALNGQQYADTGTLFQFNDYCGGQVILTDPRGQIKDHPEGSGPPRPYSFCQWIITIDIADVIPNPQEGDTIALALQVFGAPPPPGDGASGAIAKNLGLFCLGKKAL